MLENYRGTWSSPCCISTVCIAENAAGMTGQQGALWGALSDFKAGGGGLENKYLMWPAERSPCQTRSTSSHQLNEKAEWEWTPPPDGLGAGTSSSPVPGRELHHRSPASPSR